MDIYKSKSPTKYTDLFYAKLKEIFSYKSVIDFDLDALVLQLQSIEQSPIRNQTLVAVLDFRNLNALYISNNISNILKGCTSDELMGNGFFSTFNNAIVKEHSKFPFMSLNWFLKSKEDVPDSYLKSSIKAYHCGVNMQFEDEISTFLFRNRIFAFDQMNHPIFGVIYVDKINHLFKGDFFWGRFSFGQKDEYTAFHTSADSKKIAFLDIISPREKEILILISNNKDSKQIAAKLNISVNTVVKHRKNMLARSGAKDSTALVQLCKMCGVV